MIEQLTIGQRQSAFIMLIALTISTVPATRR
jgi:hypothetical protein